MRSSQLQIARAAYLRDFFLARAQGEMMEACRALSRVRAGEGPPAVADWGEEEFAFNRFFVGPRPPLAPPYASAYLEPEGLVMGQTTLRVRHLYQMAGLTSPWEGGLPDDHLALELDACFQMRQALAQTQAPQLGQVYAYFLQEHLGAWLPLFLARLDQEAGLPPVMGWVCRQLERWLGEELAELKESEINPRERT